jgi:hypothetical protein
MSCADYLIIVKTGQIKSERTMSQTVRFVEADAVGKNWGKSRGKEMAVLSLFSGILWPNAPYSSTI